MIVLRDVFHKKCRFPASAKAKRRALSSKITMAAQPLIEEASDDLINASFREALEQEKIDPVGRANLEDVQFAEAPYHFRVAVPVQPEITLPDYKAIRIEHVQEAITDADVDRAMEARRDRHVVLKEPEEPRPSAAGRPAHSADGNSG